MSRPRIFISHSAKETEAKRVLDALDACLTEAGFEVLLDQKRLREGTDWYAELDAWMETCHAAVVLLSASALASTFVAREVNILTHRRSRDDRFELLPVFLPPVDDEALKRCRLLEPARLSEIHALRAEGAPDALAERLRDDLEHSRAIIDARVVARLRDRARRDATLRNLADLLAKLGPPRMRRLAQDVDVDVREYPDDVAALLIAAAMMEAGLRRTMRMLRPILAHVERLDAANIFDLVGASWIDLQAATILQAARGDDVYVLRCRDPLTADLHVTRACRVLPHDRWTCAVVDDVTGEVAGSRGLEREVGRALAEALTCDEDEVAEYLADERDLWGNPVFVAVPASRLAPGTLRDLRAAFPGATFVALAAPAHEDAALAHLGAEPVRPPVEHQEEVRRCKQYRAFRPKLLAKFAHQRGGPHHGQGFAHVR